MNALVRRLVVGGRTAERYVECRDCGTTLSSGSATCPACGSEDAVTYEIA